jgi:hypothetical protein
MFVHSSTFLGVVLALSTGLLVSAGCGSGDDDGVTVDCEGDVPGYSELSILDTCTGCHSSDLSGEEREDAPADINFDTYEAAVDASLDAVGVLSNGVMPPPGVDMPSAAEKQDFYNWAGCGTPE